VIFAERPSPGETNDWTTRIETGSGFAWSNMLGGTIATPLGTAGVFQGSYGYWYNGSKSDGSIATHAIGDGGVGPYTYSGWTAGNFLDGAYGINSTTDSRWMAQGQATCLLDSYNLLCLGWD
jgi:hypothetical protein